MNANSSELKHAPHYEKRMRNVAINPEAPCREQCPGGVRVVGDGASSDKNQGGGFQFESDVMSFSQSNFENRSAFKPGSSLHLLPL